MGIREVVLIGIAMSMDALGLSISLGINPNLVRENKLRLDASFSFFQFFFIFLGGIVGKVFDKYVVSIPNMIGGVIITIIGVIMLMGTFKKDNRNEFFLIKKSMCFILGMSVSIDALVVGFTIFFQEQYIVLFIYSILLGLITLFICTTGFFMCKYARKVSFICKYSDVLGGLILLILGLKMIFFNI